MLTYVPPVRGVVLGLCPKPRGFSLCGQNMFGETRACRGAGSRTCPGTGASARVAPQQSPILSAGKQDSPCIRASVNHGRPRFPRGVARATDADGGFTEASNSRSIARYSSTRRTLQLSVYAV